MIIASWRSIASLFYLKTSLFPGGKTGIRIGQSQCSSSGHPVYGGVDLGGGGSPFIAGQSRAKAVEGLANGIARPQLQSDPSLLGLRQRSDSMEG
jgi:hypothetical protein